MKKATSLVDFFDLVEKVSRKVGDTFTTDDERADYLAGLNFVKAEDIVEPKKTRKTTTKKK